MSASPASLRALAGAVSGSREAPGQSFKSLFHRNSALMNDWRQDRGNFLAPRLRGQHEVSASLAQVSKQIELRGASLPAPVPFLSHPTSASFTLLTHYTKRSTGHFFRGEAFPLPRPKARLGTCAAAQLRLPSTTLTISHLSL